MFDFSWSCGSSRWTEVKRKQVFKKKSDFWVWWDEAAEPLSSNSKQHKLNRDVNSSCKYYFLFLLLLLFWFSFRCFYVTGFLLVVTAGREKWDLHLDSPSLSFYYTFFFCLGWERRGGRETTPIVTLHPTAVDFLKRLSVLLWVQSSAPPLSPFMQPSNHVKHL